MNVQRCFFVLCALVLCALTARAQQSACTVPEPQYHVNKPNIFTVEQEQWLGDDEADQLESEYFLLPEKDSAELNRIGQKLLAQLPPLPFHFTFRLYVSDDANGFSIAGGHVYISAKLITDAHSEDEVAGVLAHELGHIYAHAQAIGVTRQLAALLKVNSVTDKHDVQDKEQLLLNAPWKPKSEESGDDYEKDQRIADSIALYAMARAGYAPTAYADGLDRISDNHGRSITFFRALAGDDVQTIVRVRIARKMANALTDACKSERASSSTGFLDFQKKLRTETPRWQIDPTPGLQSIALAPPMRPALSEVRFSPDGNYLLAQERSAIHVLQRSPFKYLFTIDAEGADLPHFSPDSRHISFSFPSMRVETWDVVTGKRDSVHELIDYKGCQVGQLTPDGRTYVCISAQGGYIDLTMLDVETEKPYFEKKHWDQMYWTRADVKVLFSPDQRTMLIVAGSKVMAYDLEHRAEMSVGTSIRELQAGRIEFAGADKIAYQCGGAVQQKNGGWLYPMCVVNFPGGDKVGQFQLGNQWLETITHGDGMLVGPIGNDAAVLLDPKNGTIKTGFRLDAVDVYDGVAASETPDGSVAINELGKPSQEMVQLPIQPLRPLAAAGFSADGKFLAFSHGTRGSVWDLGKPKQVFLTRPFSGMHFSDQDQVSLHLLNALGKPGTNVNCDPTAVKCSAAAKFEENQYLASGVLITLVPQDKENSIHWNAELRVSDYTTGAQLWSRKFPHNMPEIYGTSGDSLLLVTDLLSETGDAEESHNSGRVIKTGDTMKEGIQQGLLVEIVNARTGEIQRILHTPTRPVRSNDDRWPRLVGDYLAVHGNFNNTVVYRIADGVRTAAFYGSVLAGDGKLGLLAVNNRDQEVSVYSAANGSELLRVLVDDVPRAARFIPSSNTLLVLTATQRVYSIPLPAAPPAAVTK